MRISFAFICPLCAASVTTWGEAASLDVGQRVEPFDQVPFEQHMTERHAGTSWKWGDSPTYPQGGNPLSTTRATETQPDLTSGES